ncbi:MAG: hypothetical protein JXB62_19650 [Pirellulales bacterium]|nr:hypothetical protein [Pirellulales bacterium]
MNRANRVSPAVSVALRCAWPAVLLWVGAVSPAQACNTPVFRYAMYNWPPAPYYVFYFHQGETAKEDEPVNKIVDGAFDAELPANLVLQPVDVSQPKQFDAFPKVVQEVWQSKQQSAEPLHAVFTAWGAQQYAGRLEPAQLEAMIDSPVRQRIGKLFDEGHGILLLILTGPDEEANRRAEQVADEVVAMAAGGEILVAGGDEFGMPPGFQPAAPGNSAPQGDQPGDQPAAASEAARADDSKPMLNVAVLKLARTDPKETWLVRALLSVEPDLQEFPNDSMIFAVYGRGRAMPPYLGKGITKENLADCVAFLAGACSCLVKDQNPGVDLLMRWNWDATAEKMAADDPAMGGGLSGYGYEEYAVGGSGDPMEPASGEDDPGKTATAAGGEPDPSQAAEPAESLAQNSSPTAPLAAGGANGERSGVGTQAPIAGEGPNAEGPNAEGPNAEGPAGQRPDMEGPETPGPAAATSSFAARQAWKLGLGLAVGLIVVVAAGVVLMRLQRAA